MPRWYHSNGRKWRRTKEPLDNHADKGPYSHGYGLPEVIYGCESWTVKKAECWELMVSNCGVREDLRAPWTARRSNQSTLNIHWKDSRWNWSSNTLVIWCKHLIHWKRPWCWERLKVSDDEMARWCHQCNRHELGQIPGDGEAQGCLTCCVQSMGLPRVWHNWATEQQHAQMKIQDLKRHNWGLGQINIF